MTCSLEPSPATTEDPSAAHLLVRSSSKLEEPAEGSPRTQSEREAEQRRFIRLFQQYLDTMQASAQVAPPVLDVSKVCETSRCELAAVELEYATLSKHLLDLRQGCCKIRGYKIASYAAQTAYALSALALLGTSIANYIERSDDMQWAESLSFTAMAGLTTLSATLKAKCIAMKQEKATLEGNLKEQLAQARAFNDLIQSVSEYQKTIYAKDTARTVRLLKEAIAGLVKLEDNEVDIDKVTTGFLRMLPPNHEVRQVFEEECKRVVSLSRHSGDTCSLSNQQKGGYMIDGLCQDVMMSPTKEGGEYKQPHGRKESQESSNLQASPTETPPTVLRQTSASLMKAGTGDKFDPLALDEGVSFERHRSTLRGRMKRHEDPLFARFGISLNTIYINNQPHQRW